MDALSFFVVSEAVGGVCVLAFVVIAMCVGGVGCRQCADARRMGLNGREISFFMQRGVDGGSRRMDAK